MKYLPLENFMLYSKLHIISYANLSKWGLSRNILMPFSRVSNRKSQSMQNEFISVVSSRPTLGKVETMPQISYALGKVRDNTILNHTCKYKERLCDQHHAHRGRSTS